jgi:peptide subunit release factor 1 (eRF1)
LDKCPFCGGQFEEINAAVEMAVQEALRKNADVKVIEGNDKLNEAGNIAAILRY